jgi:hypothetical protein
MRPVVKSSTMAAARNQSAMLRCSAASEQRWRSGRGGKNTARGPRAARVRAFVPFQPHQKALSKHDSKGVAVKAFPQPSLILVPAQQPFGFFMILLHPTAAVGIFDHDGQGRMRREVAPVVFALTPLTPARPLPDQPADVARAIAVHSPTSQCHKLPTQRASAALAPHHCLSVAGGQRCQDRIDALAAPHRGAPQLYPKVGSYRYTIALPRASKPLRNVGLSP